MILVDNRNVLRLPNRELLNKLSIVEENSGNFNAVIETAKTGVPTLKLYLNGKEQYVHSKYDPEREAEQLMNKLEGIESAKHILFVGSGLGYHIKKFTELYPEMKFSIYEPDEEVLVSYLSNKKLSDLPLNNLGKIFTGKDETVLLQEVTALLQVSNNNLRIYTLPIYEKVYGTQLKVILQKALEVTKDKRSAVVTNLAFQARWTVNSIKNFPTVLKTPNILHDIDRSFFEGKPAILVAAGPSLNEEFENLRYIKENGLAYIFSVGAAIDALIEQKIYPDAACTYDPSLRNQFIIQRIKQENITEIPLLFGSSVGFETLEEYPGKMLHMITSQDTVSPQLLDTTKAIDGVLDAPSIAVVTFQALRQLKCNPIILVGQNLGYQKDKKYADGISYDFVDNNLTEKEQKDSLIVKDVYGNDIQTNTSFNSMRQQLELHISVNQEIEVINTTKGGAQIEGTLFKRLDELITEKLTSTIVDKLWIEQSNTYDLKYAEKQLQLLTLAEQECKKLLQSTLEELQVIHKAMQNKQLKNMERYFAGFDKQFSQLKKNSFYMVFLEPMVRVQNERLSEESQSIRYESNVLKKAEVIVHSFNAFIHDVHAHYEFVLPYFEEMKSSIEEMSKEIGEEK